MTLHEALGIPATEKHIVSLVGGGGKTTLLYALAAESCADVPSAIFTTTHILPPSEENVSLLVPFSEENCRSLWAQGAVAAAGTPSPSDGKLAPPDEKTVSFLLREAKAVYIEADGSKRQPLKFPAAHEPVVLPESTHIVAVAGLSAVGKGPDECIQRLSLARETVDIPDEPITENTAAQLLWAGYGAYDPVFLLNQADTREKQESGERLAAILKELGARRVIITALLPSCQERQIMIR